MKCFLLLINLLFAINFSICAQQFEERAITDLRVVAIMENDTFRQNMEAYLSTIDTVRVYERNLSIEDRVIYQQKTKKYYALSNAFRESVVDGNEEVISMFAAQKKIQQDFPELAVKFKITKAQRKLLSIQAFSQLQEEVAQLSGLSLREVAPLVKEAVEQYH